MAACALIVCVLSVVLFKELKVLCFDPGFAAGMGFSPRLLDGLLMTLIVLAVVVGLQAVGVVLMAAMLIIPAAAARLWTDRLGRMVALAGAVGAASGVLGTLLSLQSLRMPTGPLIVLSATTVFLGSFLFAPRRGLLPRLHRYLALRRRVARENVLRALYELAERMGPWNRPVRLAEVAGHGEEGLRGAVPSSAGSSERDCSRGRRPTVFGSRSPDSRRRTRSSATTVSGRCS